MGLRIVGKSIIMSMRTKRRFIPFVIIYVSLIVWLSFILEQTDLTNIFTESERENLNMLLISFSVSIIMSVLYVQIIIYNRKKEIVTLKCIGWTNQDIGTLLIGEVMWVITVGFLIVFELLIHHAAVVSYYWHQNGSSANWDMTKPFLSIPNILLTLLLFVSAQLVGVWMIYRKIAKLRPIVAVRVMK